MQTAWLITRFLADQVVRRRAHPLPRCSELLSMVRGSCSQITSIAKTTVEDGETRSVWETEPVSLASLCLLLQLSS